MVFAPAPPCWWSVWDSNPHCDTTAEGNNWLVCSNADRQDYCNVLNFATVSAFFISLFE